MGPARVPGAWTPRHQARRGPASKESAMLSGIPPPAICLTTRSISFRPHTRRSRDRLRTRGALLSGSGATEPHDGRQVQVQQVRGPHVVLGELLRASLPFVVTGHRRRKATETEGARV